MHGLLLELHALTLVTRSYALWLLKMETCVYQDSLGIRHSGGSKGGEHRAHSPPLELSNAVLLGRGLAVATYISLTSHLLPPESRLLASYTTH